MWLSVLFYSALLLAFPKFTLVLLLIFVLPWLVYAVMLVFDAIVVRPFCWVFRLAD